MKSISDSMALHEAPPAYEENYYEIPTTVNPSAPPLLNEAEDPVYPPQSCTEIPNVVVTSYPPIKLSSSPVEAQCPHCNSYIVSKVFYVTGCGNYLFCTLCLLVGCVLGCCFIPFCANGLSNVEHRCPRCSHYLGTYKRIGI